MPTNPTKNAVVSAPGTSSAATGVSKSATTNAAGLYTIKPIPPGDYTVTVTAAGFNDFKAADINAKLGTATTLDVALEDI